METPNSERASKLFIKPATERVLMSDVLRGQVPEIEDDQPIEPAIAGEGVIVIAHKLTGGATKEEGMVGILRGIHLGKEPEIEFRVELKEALDVIEAKGLSFPMFELHHGERIIQIPGPFIVEAARLDEIMIAEQMCTLGLHLKKPAR